MHSHEIDCDTKMVGKKVGKLLLIKPTIDRESLEYLDEKAQGSVIALDGQLGREFLFKASALGAVSLIVSDDQKDIVGGEDLEKKIKVLNREVIISLPLFWVSGEEGKIKPSIWEILTENEGKSIILDGDSKKIYLPS